MRTQSTIPVRTGEGESYPNRGLPVCLVIIWAEVLMTCVRANLASPTSYLTHEPWSTERGPGCLASGWHTGREGADRRW